MINRMFRRSDSSTSIRSSSTNPPEIPQEDGTINSESYQLSDLDQKLGDWNIPKVPTTQVLRNPELDVVQQLADGTVRLSFDQSRFRSPLEYEPSPRSSLDLHQDTYQEPRSRSVDLHQLFGQPAILLRDRPASQCNSSRTRTPRSAQFQGVKDHSQVSTPCYTAKQDSVADQEEDSNSQDSLKPPSPSGANFRNPIQQSVDKRVHP